MAVHERFLSQRPDRIIVRLDLDFDSCQEMANVAVSYAKQSMPKISGRLAGTISAVYGEGYFGLYFPDKRAWFLEKGTNPFTMNSLAGKTIPMWVEDPDWEQAREIGPKAKTRVTVDGRKQTLIFRRAAKKGERKSVIRNGVRTTVPKSYPGAPGRISSRLNGAIASGNVGVRWRHPGITGRKYLINAVLDCLADYGAEPEVILYVDSATISAATRTW